MADNIKIFSYFLIFVLGLFLSSCTPGPLLTFKNEINDSSTLWGGYVKDRIYTLEHDLFIRNNSRYTSDQLRNGSKILVPPKILKQGGLYSAPESIDSFLDTPEKYPDVIGIVKQGTTIQCVQIIEYIPVGYRPSLFIYATIQNGLFKGYLVEISDVSSFYSKSKEGIQLKMPDMFFLK